MAKEEIFKNATIIFTKLVDKEVEILSCSTKVNDRRIDFLMDRAVELSIRLYYKTLSKCK